MGDFESIGPGEYRLEDFPARYRITWDMVERRFNSDDRWHGPFSDGRYLTEVHDEKVEVTLEKDDDSIKIDLGEKLGEVEEEEGDVLRDIQKDVLEEYFLPHHAQHESLDEILAPQLDPEPVDYFDY